MLGSVRKLMLLLFLLALLPSLGLQTLAVQSDKSSISQSDNQNHLRSALRKLIPRARKDPVERLLLALEQQKAGEQEVMQVLEAHRIQSIEGYFTELKGRIDGTRAVLARSQEELLKVSNSKMMSQEEKNQQTRQLMMEITEQQREARLEKLKPKELSALIKFYKSLNPELNRLIEPKPIFYNNTRKARLAAEVTAWPVIELREHGFDLSQVPYGPSESKKWRETAQAFWDQGLKFEFLEIWAQLVNQTAGHMRYRHLEGFDFRFLFELRKWALEKDPFRARDLFVAYVSNYSSSQMIARNGVDLKNWSDKDKKSLAYQIILLQNIKNRKELVDLFESGQAPKRFPESNSKTWNQAMASFATAKKYPDRETCITALVKAASEK